MNEIDMYKFQNEILIFKNTISPSLSQKNYLLQCKDQIHDEIVGKAKKSGHSPERCLLVALCGELTMRSSKQQQAEFATRLLLLELLTES
jgi:hypothetical protein